MILGAILDAKTAYQRRGLPIMDDFQYLAMRIPRMGEREYALPTRGIIITSYQDWFFVTIHVTVNGNTELSSVSCHVEGWVVRA